MSDAREDHARSVLDGLEIGVLSLDAGLAVRLMNRTAGRMMGISAHDCEGRPASDLLSPEILESAREAARSGRARLGVAGRARTSQGEMRPVRASVSPLAGSPGSEPGTVVSFTPMAGHDRSERRRQMEQRMRELGEFTAGVAHVVRNPLTGISSGVEFMARQAPRDPVQAENVAAILREVRRLDGLLEELLRITHPTALDLRPVRLEGLLREVALDLKSRFPRVTVHDSCEASVGEPLLDGEQLRRALAALASNAAEASPEGSPVEISARLEAPDGALAELGEPLLRIDVTDRGPGLPAPVRRAPFEPFRSGRSGGRGVGLYTAHDIATRHGGELRLTDREAGGTCATFHLPWEIRDDP
jgi:PAS domain S-box-containing protein